MFAAHPPTLAVEQLLSFLPDEVVITAILDDPCDDGVEGRGFPGVQPLEQALGWERQHHSDVRSSGSRRSLREALDLGGRDDELGENHVVRPARSRRDAGQL